jgi:hypothetical protein
MTAVATGPLTYSMSVMPVTTITIRSTQPLFQQTSSHPYNKHYDNDTTNPSNKVTGIISWTLLLNEWLYIVPFHSTTPPAIHLLINHAL